MSMQDKTNMHRTWRLFSQVQNYAWGTKNRQAFIPKLLGVPIEPELPYAELWIGAHPKSPSVVVPHGSQGYKLKDPITLDKFIENNPTELLGEKVFKRFGAKLPFLAKILSAGDNLSIQVHPTMEQAKVLHKKDPLNYPDDWHKPEIAIAIDSVSTLAGFRPFNEILDIFTQLPEFANCLEPDLCAHFVSLTDKTEQKSVFQKIFYTFCQKAESDSSNLITTVKAIENRLQEEALHRKLSTHEQLFVYLRNRYGYDDPGLIILFFLNYQILKPGEALTITPGMPHAYLDGTLFECMATSDNVVRAGLSPKFRDLTTLSEITKVQLEKPILYKPRLGASQFHYPIFCEEFSVERFKMCAEDKLTQYHPNSPWVLFLLEGRIKLNYTLLGEDYSEDYRDSHCIFFPANMSPIDFQITEDCDFFLCKVPNS
jgi:mannose-6-phosphate isomerase